jgi:patatin-like phospholipase/acyl hydrolase
MFSSVGGTSIGGILALGLTATEDGKNPIFQS